MQIKQEKLPRRAQADKTRQKLFQTAVALIRSKGYHQTTVDEICREAGVSKGTFYVHYSSKEDIVRDSYYENIGDYVNTHFAQWCLEHPDSSISEQITEFLYLELAFTDAAGYELVCLAYAMNFSSCVPSPSRHLEKRVFTKTLQALVDKGVKEGMFEAGLSAADIFLFVESTVRGIMQSWCFCNASFDIKEKGRIYIDLLLGRLLRK